MSPLMNIKIEKYQKIAQDKYRIILATGEVLELWAQVILNNDLLLKKELSPDLYQKVVADNLIYSGYYSSLKFISYRVRSKKEIINHLTKKEEYNEYLDQIIELLIKNNQIDDEIFAKAYINDKIKLTSWGPYKIKVELKKHNISDQLINKYLNLSEDLVYEKALKIAQKLQNTNSNLDKYKLKNKIYNNLFRLGYEFDIISKVLNDIL